MIKRIDIENFKLFGRNESFNELKPLTIVTGVNGKGKSSFLQSMTVMAQSINHKGELAGLNLNGSYANLGNYRDVKNTNMPIGREISFTFHHNDEWLKTDFSGEDLISSVVSLKNIDGTALNILPILRDVSFVSAERVGPKFSYPASNDLKRVGATGEYTACAIYNNQFEPVRKQLIESIPDIFPEINIEDLDSSFLGVLNFWLSEMFGDVNVISSYIDEVNQYVLKFRTDKTGNDYKPLNVGYGFSYALPILAAGLLAEEGSVLILENPEAHLHPKAQSILGKFLAWISIGGVQVFVETHSEHIFNAPRVLVVQDAYDNNDIAVLYFGDFEGRSYENIKVLDTGKVDHWPDGFFDQMEKDNDIILQLL